MNKPTPLGKKSYAEYEKEIKKFKNSTEVNFSKTYKIQLQIAEEVSDALDKVMQEQTLMNNASAEVDAAFKEIDFSFFEEMRDVLGEWDRMEKLTADLDSAMQNMNTKAGELGLDPSDFSPDYKKAIEVLNEIDREEMEWMDYYEVAKNLSALR